MNPRQARSSISTRRSRPSHRPLLESLEARQLLATFQVTNASDGDVPGSLRRAIIDANKSGGADRIEFGIPGEGTQTIRLGSPLPEITDTLVIDGYTQSDVPSYYGKPLIELVGPSTAGNAVTVAGANSKLIGLAINGANGAGIRIAADDVTVTGCFLGAPPVGGSSNPNTGSGILIASGRRVTIGGTQPGQLNVIAASQGAGIQVEAAASTTTIIGNMIGLDGSGQVGMPNAVGIVVNGASVTRIGGTEPGQSNVISGNVGAAVLIQGDARFTRVQANRIGVSQDGLTVIANGSGVQVLGGTSTLVGGLNEGEGNLIGGNRGAGVVVSGVTGTLIQGNRIGTDASGTRNLGNGAEGVRLEAGARLTGVGGLVAGAANTIAFNGGAGVSVVGDTTQSNPILSNAIFANRGLGIDLGGNGVTPNSGTGSGVGPNALQPYPVITKAATAGGRTLVQGSFSGVPNTTYRVQYFASATADASGFGEGQRLVGQQDLTTNSQGAGRINVVLETPTGVGEVLSTTLTSLPTETGNTSEFSNARPVAVAQQADLVLSLKANPDPGTIGTAVRYTLTVFNRGPDAATDVNLDQLLPTGGTLGAITSSQGTTSVAAGMLTARLGSLAAGASATVTVTFTPTVIGSLVTSAEVSSGEIDIDGSNNTATLSTRVGNPADLSVALRGEPTPAVEGLPVEFVAVVTNNGPGAAGGVVLRTPRPVGAELLGAYTGQGTVTINTHSIIVDMGVLAPSSSVVVRIIVKPPTAGTLSQSVQVSTQDIDPNLANNAASATAVVRPAADLAVVELSSDPSTFGADATGQFVIQVRNSGPTSATNAVARFEVPDGFQVGTLSSSQGGLPSFDPVTRRVTAALGAMPRDGVATLIVQVTAPKTSSRQTATATITSDAVDLAPEDNTASQTVLTEPADLALVNYRTQPALPLPGRPFDLVLDVRNNGQFRASDVVVTQTLPAGLTYLSATTPQGTVSFDPDRRVVTATLGEQSANQIFTIRVRVQAAAALQGVAAAQVTTANFDPEPGNDRVQTAVLVGASDLMVSLLVADASPFAGDVLVYTALITNRGPALVDDAGFLSVLPAGLQLVSVTSSQGTITNSGGRLEGRLGTLGVGQWAAVEVRAIPLVGGPLTLEVSGSGGRFEAYPMDNTSTVSRLVQNAPGTLGFETSSITVDESAGTAAITLRRTQGLLGPVSVRLRTVDGTARAGVQYGAVDQVVQFAAGQAVQSVAIPLIRDLEETPDLSFGLRLSNPTGGATLGSPTATVVIRNVDRDTIQPVVDDVALHGAASRIDGLTLRFSEPMDAARVSNPANYRLVLPSGATVPVQSASYDAAANTVLIVPGGGIAAGSAFSTLVVQTGGTGVIDRHGNAIAGSVNGAYTVTFARGTSLRYLDSDGDQVSLQLARGGYLDMVRNAAGEAQVVRVSSSVPGRSVLSGSVRRTGQRGNGVTNLGRIDGLQVGVHSTLTTGPFYVANQIQATPPPPPRPAAIPRGPLAAKSRARS